MKFMGFMNQLRSEGRLAHPTRKHRRIKLPKLLEGATISIDFFELKPWNFQPKNSHAIEGVLIEGDMVRNWGIRAKATQDSILLENDVQLSFSVVTFLRDILSILLGNFCTCQGCLFLHDLVLGCPSRFESCLQLWLASPQNWGYPTVHDGLFFFLSQIPILIKIQVLLVSASTYLWQVIAYEFL